MLSHVVFIVCSVMLVQSWFLLGFSQRVFLPLWFFSPLVDVGHHPPKCCSFFAYAPALVCVVCSMIRNDDVFVWRAQQAPYHILSMVMCMACW